MCSNLWGKKKSIKTQLFILLRSHKELYRHRSIKCDIFTAKVVNKLSKETFNSAVCSTFTFWIVDHIHDVPPAGLRCMKDPFHESHPPHALRHGAPEPQAARAGKLSRDRWKQDGTVVLRRDLHGLLVFLLRHSNITFRHFPPESATARLFWYWQLRLTLADVANKAEWVRLISQSKEELCYKSLMQ